MANHGQQWSSKTPGLLIILLDQSGSMLLPYEGNDSKTVFATKAVNRVIDTIIEKNYDGEEPKNRGFISVIGYNHNIKEECSGWLTDLDASPRRIEEITKKVPDGAGGLVEIKQKMPVWVDPITEDGATNMKGAFRAAKDIISQWVQKYPDSPAPVIINISDGCPYYDGKSPSICMVETTQVAKEIMALKTNDGEVLIFNARIGEDGESVIFPTSRDILPSEEAQFLFDISSDIPDAYYPAASKYGLKVQPGSKGCIFNADGVQLIQLINFGSTGGQDISISTTR